MRILVVAPPAGVRFAVQRGRADLLDPSGNKSEAIRFDLSFRVGTPLLDGSPNFLGDFAQGPPAERFVYLNCGTLAGQADTGWTRRAKLKLATIPTDIVAAATGSGQAIIEARVKGMMPDGSPVCGSIKADAVAWSLVR